MSGEVSHVVHSTAFPVSDDLASEIQVLDQEYSDHEFFLKTTDGFAVFSLPTSSGSNRIQARREFEEFFAEINQLCADEEFQNQDCALLLQSGAEMVESIKPDLLTFGVILSSLTITGSVVAAEVGKHAGILFKEAGYRFSSLLIPQLSIDKHQAIDYHPKPDA